MEALEPERRRGIQRLGDRKRGVLRAVGLERRSDVQMRVGAVNRVEVL